MHFLPPLEKEDRGGFERLAQTKKVFQIPPNLPLLKGGAEFICRFACLDGRRVADLYICGAFVHS